MSRRSSKTKGKKRSVLVKKFQKYEKNTCQEEWFLIEYLRCAKRTTNLNHTPEDLSFRCRERGGRI